MGKWLYNEDGNALINEEHIIKMQVMPPAFERKTFVVVADLTYGTEIMYSGSEKGCCDYLQELIMNDWRKEDAEEN